MGLISRFGTTYTVRRYASGSLVKGRWVPDASYTETEIIASIQPMSGRERELLPEGERTKEIIRIYTKHGLRQAMEKNNVKGDQVSYKGRMYEVKRVDTWDFDWNNMAHFKAMATLVEDD
jgi:hypothetical protein